MPSPEPAPSDALKVEARAALVVAAGGVALVLAGFTFGASPLFVPGIGFLLLGGLSPWWVGRCARSARVRRRLSTQRVVENEPLEAAIEIRRGRFGLPGAVVLDPIAGRAGGIPVADAVSLISGEPRIELRVVARIRRRGRHTFAAPALRLTDPLGLVRMTRRGYGQADEVLVLPRIEPVRWVDREYRRTLTGQAVRTTLEPMGAGEIDGLRQYMPGSPASRIHWPSLARHQFPPTLLERRLVSAPQAQPMIVLDARLAADAESESRLDAAVRAATSLAVALARAGGCSLLLPGDRISTLLGPDLSAWSSLHIRLALVEGDRYPRHGPALRDESARGPLIYVTAQLGPGAGLPVRRRGAGDLILVIPPHAPGAPDQPPALVVAGCAGYVIRRTRRAPLATRSAVAAG